ncbi:MAG: septal ring lytic transglycosylase RlpA family protein, partial [Burkholderiaceae bacterium]|nr:septal ring lytic transglycosylase RlpA family protein [Burkholderiaceae bacterium]
ASTKVKVTNLKNGRSVVVRIIDRGPFIAGRIIDLNKAAANALGSRFISTLSRDDPSSPIQRNTTRSATRFLTLCWLRTSILALCRSNAPLWVCFSSNAFSL